MLNLVYVLSVALVAFSAPCALADPINCKPALIENLVVFGDSYSDTGNVYKLSHHAWPLPFYDHGRFSNGPVWSEHVARTKKYKLTNYAFGGATSDAKLIQGYSGANSTIPVPGFIQQLSLYASHASPKDVAKTLFVVDFQGNDWFFNSSLAVDTVVGRLKEGIEHLVELGARNILLVENFDFGLIPYFSTNADVAKLFSSIASSEQTAYKNLEIEFADVYGPVKDANRPFRNCRGESKTKVHIGYMNLWELFLQLQQAEELKRLGITNITQGCVSMDYKTVCQDAGKHFYWDDFHPTAKIHKEIASAVLSIL